MRQRDEPLQVRFAGPHRYRTAARGCRQRPKPQANSSGHRIPAHPHAQTFGGNAGQFTSTMRPELGDADNDRRLFRIMGAGHPWRQKGDR
jgi:hypothetical protein